MTGRTLRPESEPAAGAIARAGSGGNVSRSDLQTLRDTRSYADQRAFDADPGRPNFNDARDAGRHYSFSKSSRSSKRTTRK